MNKINVKQYLDINEYLNENLSFLEKEEAVNNLLIGIPSALKDGREIEPFPVLISVFKEEEIIFSCVQTPPRHLILYGKGEVNDVFIDAFAEFILGRGINFFGLVGPKQLATSFAEKWCAKNRLNWSVKFEQLIYRLDKMEKINYSGGRLREAEPRDAKILENWFYTFNKEALGEDDPEGAAIAANNKIAEGGLFVWENDGSIVSMAAASRPTRNGITINYVFTPSGYRGFGYATSCVGKLTEKMLEKYRFCSLFTDQANPTSNGIYLKIGYRPVAEFRMVDFSNE